MSITFIEGVFVNVLFPFLMGVATVLLYGDTTDALLALQGTLHLPITIIQVCLSLVAAFLISTRWRRVAAAGLRAWPLLIIVAIQILSITWSIDPGITTRKVAFELVMLSIGIYLGERYTTDALAKILAKILCQTMVLIICLFFVAPHFVVDAEQHNALKGLSQNKNAFGFYIGLAVALLFLLRFRRRDRLRYVFLPIAIGMLLLSRSMTSVASATIILMSLPFLLVARLRPRQRAAGYLVLAVAMVIFACCAVVFSDNLLALLGKDATLTGRTEVWKQLMIAIRHHPFLGYGYGAFWTGVRGESLDVLVAAGWLVPSAHNAYLDLYIALGLPGAVATAVAFWKALRMSIEYIRAVPGWPGLWPVACILFVLVHGLGESEFIYDASFACCLFTALYTSMALRSPRPHRVRISLGTPAQSVRFVTT